MILFTFSKHLKQIQEYVVVISCCFLTIQRADHFFARFPTHTLDDTGFNSWMLEYILTCNGTFTMLTLDKNTEIINIQLLITLEIV